IFGIRVISFDEEELSWSTVLVREGACRFILKFPLLMLGYIPAIFNQKKQHLGDLFTNTSVVTINLIKAFNQEVNS
ncbi:RDD family protein, partial [Enterococcus lactis]